MSETYIKGGKQLDDLLQTLPLKLEKNILRGALGAGARVIMREAKALAPVGRPSNVSAKEYGGYPGALRDSIRVRSGFTKKGEAYASIKAGGTTKKGATVFWAHIVEFGARQHIIRPRAKKALNLGGTFVAGAVEHPGVRPQPFMRPAADTKMPEAVLTITKYIRRRFEKEGIDIPAAPEDTE